MIKVGDKVVMNDRYYVLEKNKGKEFTVTSKPRNVSGTKCVSLQDYSGCYALDGLTRVGGKQK